MVLRLIARLFVVKHCPPYIHLASGHVISVANFSLPFANLPLILNTKLKNKDMREHNTGYCYD